jgi:hypothetical protein
MKQLNKKSQVLDFHFRQFFIFGILLFITIIANMYIALYEDYYLSQDISTYILIPCTIVLIKDLIVILLLQRKLYKRSKS